MAHDMDFVGYLEDSLTDLEKQHIEQHLVDCGECRRFLADMEKSIHLFTTLYTHHPDMMDPDSPSGDDLYDFEDLEPSDLIPLPSGIENRLSPRQDVKTRLQQALAILQKQTDPENNDLLKDTIHLADRILNAGTAPEPAWALDRESTTPKPEGLSLRHPDEHDTLTISLDAYCIEIHKQDGKTRVKVLKNMHPVEQVPVSVQTRADTKTVLTTDKNGMIFF